MAGFTRRRALLGAACTVGCVRAGCAQPAPALACTDGADLTAPPPLALSPAEEERHGIFLMLAMALVFDAWGVDRDRPELLAAYAAAEPGRRFGDYAGHNVGAVLVDRSGSVVCCALNRNVLLNSPMAHAEARAVGAAIGLANAARPERWSFGSLLQGTVLYTTLEPCSQCAGIMEIANLGSVVYGQDDPAQHKVANVLYNLRRRPNASAGLLPVRASFMPYWAPLAAAYDGFLAEAAAGARAGLTAFLQTVGAYRVYRDAAQGFERAQAQDPANEAVLRGARAFRERWQASVRDDGIAPPA